ncbi:calcium-transporting P-type ATPase, PMR1-type [Caldisalinibacter kiritimatiensis]|uniref:P-type Ca(2+) transporter n=1 Tax=Caldisalinibacter kiritimatiensis TaxID=1304284 RepID=R1ASG3_9FIRM|nr:calcium-transporting P-type ATPase, PMR1-type [Caldisalinibacter kiritimatiensis]EOC99596.1 Lead, cadmium, zinc and mercury transporting ATPase / Copper-translocating P-type ATPase [Caldisalinibacter kiritimatiensis]
MAHTKWYKKSIDEVVNELNVDLNKGLSNEEVKNRKEKYGANELREGERISPLRRFLNQFKDFMVIILIIAAIVSGALGEISDTIIIFIVVLLNATLGFIQENRAEESLRALKSMSTPQAKVLRNGNIIEVKSPEIVPGDIVILEAGDFIPADGRIIESANLMIEESALTGESVPVSKNTDIPEGDEVPIGDRKNMVFSTGLVTHGRGKFIVTDTGMNTEIGKIAEMLESQEDLKTPLQEKLEGLGKWLGIIALGICAIIFAIGTFQGRPVFDMFMLAVSLAVAAIPEGLPAIVTIVLSLGVQRMIKKNAIIRKLPAVETLGTASVICSDKTGTLTQNKMTVTKVYTYNDLNDINQFDINQFDKNLAVQVGLLCNDSSIQEDDGEKRTIGDPTEIALVVLAYEKGMLKKEQESELPRVEEIPFESDRKLMSTIHKTDDKYRVFTKGAIDVLLDRCNKVLIGEEIKDITEEIKKDIKKANENMAADALRVLGLAFKDISNIPEKVTSDTIENDLVFVGMVGMIDPPREEVKAAVDKCKRAGIKPVMITGDYKVTAMAIAKELGILQKESEAVEGRAIENMSDDELYENVTKYSVYARVSPEHKVRIVKAWQRHGKIVAMTGDGVNDAPALKRANIGCAMGITGTDVSKEASDMILTDDNFATIVAAVEEGRTIYDNIKKSIHFLLSCNIGEIIALLIAILLNLPAPLLPIHILWVNLVTDSFPALALGVDPAEPDIMNRKPRDPKVGIFAGGLGLQIVLEGAIVGLVTLLAFYIGRYVNLETGITMAFVTLSFAQLVHSLNVRSINKSIFKLGLFSNKYQIAGIFTSVLLTIGVVFIPFIREVFKLSLIDGAHWLYAILLSFVPLVVVEIAKLIKTQVKGS